MKQDVLKKMLSRYLIKIDLFKDILHFWKFTYLC